jgi:hypothetical protein
VLGKSDGVLEQKQSIKMLMMKSGGRLSILTAAPVFLMQYILNRTIAFFVHQNLLNTADQSMHVFNICADV